MHQNADQNNRSLLIGLSRNQVSAMDRSNGHIRWRAELPSRARADLVVHASCVFVLQDQVVHCFDYETGQKLGAAEMPFRVVTTSPRILADAGQLIVMDSNAFACFSLDGQLLWQQTEDRSSGALGPFGFPDNVLPPDWTN